MLAMMKRWWKILLLPLLFHIIFLGLSSFNLFRTTTNFDHDKALLSKQIRNEIFSQVENTARFFIPLNSSASSLATILNSSINGTQLLSFNLIQQKVAPLLFVALSTIPYVSHASYIGIDGLSFLYYNKNAEIVAVFSNSSSSSSSSSSCYTQPVNRDTGELSGQAVGCGTSITNFNITSVRQTVNRTAASAWLGAEWDEEKGLLFLYNAALSGRGLITIGYPTKVVIDHFADLEFNAGDFHLATSNGQVLVESKLNDTRVDVRNNTVSVETVDVNGVVEGKTDFYSCKSDGGELSHFHIKIRGHHHIFYCKTLEIGGIQFVYVLVFPTGVERSAYKTRILTIVLMVLMVGVIVVSFGNFIIVILRSAQREMLARAALINQMESTEQEKRKSMNKSLAFATASHDIRASLAAISGLIDLCRGTIKPRSELAANLDQMSTCAMDLLGILNSVLETRKIEAGKLQLEEEEFDVALLVEDVVDMFYPLAMKRGVDVVLDPTDCSILKFSLVKGDRGKLKQILCNLLSNATKFTSEGHISVRATVKRTTIQNQIITASNTKIISNSCLSRMFYNHNESFSSLEAVEEDPNYMDYIFEVDDTGKGIPKERRDLVFENFVQVKETALGQGTGLGLGIIQSLVRLMGGEIKIVDKDQGERGTCFRFNVVLSPCHPPSGDMEGTNNTSNDGYDIHQCFGMRVDSLPSRLDTSHVILFLEGEERRRVTKRLMQRFGLRVSIVRRSEDLVHFLGRIEQKIELPQATSSNSASNNSHEEPNSLLVVIDANADPNTKLCSVLANSREIMQKLKCKIVWLDNPIKRSNSEEKDDDNKRITIIPPPCDHILSRPLHGSHLYRVLGLLPEFEEETRSSPQERWNEVEATNDEEGGSSGNDMPLTGKNVLVVEDDKTLCMLSTTILHKLGATTQVCENGKEAFDLVCTTLQNKEAGSLPFDYIFMDCKMPFLDGFEATRLIRKEEAAYGVHTPIVALTAYSTEEEISQAFDAGMDVHLVKPLRIENVLKIINTTPA
ncbi:hypothetical protein C2S52_004645 [Perilla frutescens var. hirtella]|nr:hypothetical protein C2S52_004645 [Perilla frutescens var. hirtella]